jgi:hypothetical protein
MHSEAGIKQIAEGREYWEFMRVWQADEKGERRGVS